MTAQSDTAAIDKTLLDVGALKTIYSFRMPETEWADEAVQDLPSNALAEVLEGIRGNFQSVAQTIRTLRAPYHDMHRAAWMGHPDTAHENFFNTWLDWTAPVLHWDNTQFPNRYPTHGASDALYHTISQYALNSYAQDRKPRIHIFEGEYEGFAAYAKECRCEVITHKRSEWRKSIEKIAPFEQFYISQPSSIDGNVWDEFDTFSKNLAEIQPKAELMVDLTYVGCIGRDYSIDLTSPNIQAVIFSLSKPFGVYYSRIGGILSRKPYGDMFGNKWFKNLRSLAYGTKLMQSFGVRELPQKYRDTQEAAIDHMSHTLSLPGLKATDVFILASAPLTGSNPAIESYAGRGEEGMKRVRLCLTPYMAMVSNPAAYQQFMPELHETLFRNVEGPSCAIS